MITRLALGLAAAAALVAGCSGSDDEPEVQSNPTPSTSSASASPSTSASASASAVATPVPADAPADWTATDLGPVTVSTPPGWARQATARPAANIVTTTWRAPEVDGTSPAGMEVRVITSPQQEARQASLALQISASASLGARDVEREEVDWPRAEEAYALAYTSRLAAAPGSAFATRTLVLDLADGTQVQVNALADDASGGGDLADDAIAAVVVDAA